LPPSPSIWERIAACGSWSSAREMFEIMVAAVAGLVIPPRTKKPFEPFEAADQRRWFTGRRLLPPCEPRLRGPRRVEMVRGRSREGTVPGAYHPERRVAAS